MFPNRNIRYVRRRTVSALFFTLLLCWATVLAASAADTNAPQSGLKTGIDASATSGQAAGDVKATATTDPLARPVSYGLRVLSAREEMVLSGLCGNEITVTRDDICRALNLSSVSAITLTALPDQRALCLSVRRGQRSGRRFRSRRFRFCPLPPPTATPPVRRPPYLRSSAVGMR